MEKSRKLSGYYGMKADLSGDIERMFRKKLGFDIFYDGLIQEILKKYGFGEKIVLEMLKPYEKEGQFFFDTLDDKKIISIAPDWKMGESQKLFDDIFN